MGQLLSSSALSNRLTFSGIGQSAEDIFMCIFGFFPSCRAFHQKMERTHDVYINSTDVVDNGTVPLIL